MNAVPPELLGLRGGGVESWFMKANAPDGTRALWTRCTIFARPGLPTVAEAWVIAFDRHRGHVAVKSTLPFEEGRFAKDAVDVEVDGCRLQTSGARGTLSSGRGTVTWDLAFGPSLVAPIVHLPALWMYRDGVPPFSKLVTPVADARANGEVVVERGDDRESWPVSDWPMMIGHNWGRGNAELYAWTHCNTWEIDRVPAPGLVFEALSARVRIGPLLSPMATMVFLRWRGKSWDLSSPRALQKNRGSISLRRWDLASEDRGLDIACDVAAETDDVVGLHYPNPNGPFTHCLNTKLARARLDVRFPDGEILTATSRAAALEIGTLQTDHGVKMVL